MNLGQIKTALNKFPADMDTSELIMVFNTPEGQQYELLCAVGILPINDSCAVGLCGHSHIKKQVEEGTIPKPENYDLMPPEEGEEWKQGI